MDLSPTVDDSHWTNDFDYVQAMTQVDQEVLEIVAKPFIQQWPGELHKITHGLATRELKTVLHTAHALKGTLLMFGAVPAADLAQRMEQCAQDQDAIGVAELVAPLAEVLNHLIAAISVHCGID
jgi:HPt (histidine-containing phosphotransfer) domain-containing protein